MIGSVAGGSVAGGLGRGQRARSGGTAVGRRPPAPDDDAPGDDAEHEQREVERQLRDLGEPVQGVVRRRQEQVADRPIRELHPERRDQGGRRDQGVAGDRASTLSPDAPADERQQRRDERDDHQHDVEDLQQRADVVDVRLALVVDVIERTGRHPAEDPLAPGDLLAGDEDDRHHRDGIEQRERALALPPERDRQAGVDHDQGHDEEPLGPLADPVLVREEPEDGPERDESRPPGRRGRTARGRSGSPSVVTGPTRRCRRRTGP